VRTGGNVTPVASFNIVVDPEAAFIVYQSGIPVVQVGLDVCDHVTETDAHTPVTDFIIKVLEFRRTQAVMPVVGPRGEIRQIQSHIRARPGSTDVRLNDVVAAGYVVDPTLFRGENIYITIETKGEETAGMTVADFRGQLGKDPNATVLLEVNGQALADRWTRDIINCGR
jgi:inosine-uridine nucleoside N-ribohydrolase